MADYENTILLTDEEGQEHEFIVVDILEVKDKEYAILLPAEMVDDNAEAIVLKVEHDEDGCETLCEIDDETEWEQVAQAWEELVDEEYGDEEDEDEE